VEILVAVAAGEGEGGEGLLADEWGASRRVGEGGEEGGEVAAAVSTISESLPSWLMK